MRNEAKGRWCERVHPEQRRGNLGRKEAYASPKKGSLRQTRNGYSNAEEGKRASEKRSQVQLFTCKNCQQTLQDGPNRTPERRTRKKSTWNSTNFWEKKCGRATVVSGRGEKTELSRRRERTSQGHGEILELRRRKTGDVKRRQAVQKK